MLRSIDDDEDEEAVVYGRAGVDAEHSHSGTQEVEDDGAAVVLQFVGVIARRDIVLKVLDVELNLGVLRIYQIGRASCRERV